MWVCVRLFEGVSGVCEHAFAPGSDVAFDSAVDLHCVVDQATFYFLFIGLTDLLDFLYDLITEIVFFE